MPSTSSVLLLPPNLRPQAKRLGAYFDRSAKCWRIDGEVPRPLLRYAPVRHSPEFFRLIPTDGVTAPSDRHDPNVALRPHQRKASDAVVRAHSGGLPGFLLADEVGLGKTYAVLDALRRLGSCRSVNPLNVLVLAPLSVVPHWRRSIDLYPTPNVRFCVTNYEKAKSLLFEPSSAKQAKRTRTKNKRHSQQGPPTRPAPNRIQTAS